MIRQILDYLGYVQTWLWIWGIVGTSTIGVLIWALVTRLPSAAVFVLALGTGTLMLIALETVLVVYEKISRAPYKRAVSALNALRSRGVALRNRDVTTDAELAAFVEDLGTFEADALAAMQGAATQTDIAWFRDLHLWKVEHGVVAYNKDHALLKAILDEKLRRMLTIAQQIETKIR